MNLIPLCRDLVRLCSLALIGGGIPPPGGHAVVPPSGLTPQSAVTRPLSSGPGTPGHLLPVYHFNRITTADGLPTQSIRSRVARDSRGFIWIPTMRGLARYDGNSCRVYRQIDDQTSDIAPMALTAIHVDAGDRVWLGTWDQGLSLFDPGEGRFINFPVRTGDTNWIGNHLIRAIREDGRGNIVLLTDGELVAVNTSELRDYTDPDSIRRYIRFTTYRPGPLWTKVWDYATWNGDTLLISTEGETRLLDLVTGSVSGTGVVLPDAVPLDSIGKIVFHREGRTTLWMVTQNHDILRWNDGQRTFTWFPRDDRDHETGRSDVVYGAGTGPFGRLWIGTSTGFDLFDPSLGRFIRFLYSSTGPGYDGFRPRITADRTGTLWISGGESGLYYLDPASTLIRHYGVPDTGLTPTEMRTIERWDDGTVWIGRSGRALNVDPRSLKILREIDVLGGKSPKSPLWAGESSSYNDGKGNLWYGTWGLGLYRIEPATGRVTNYRASTDLSDNLLDICWSVTGGADGKLWIAGNVDGVLRFDPVTGRFSRPEDSLLISCRNASHVTRDGKGDIWVSDENRGLVTVEHSGTSAGRFTPDGRDHLSLGMNVPRKTLPDSRGGLWIGGQGLDYHDMETGSFRHYPNDIFTGAFPIDPMGVDEQGRVWVRYASTGLGLLDTSTGRYQNFTEREGLVGNPANMAELEGGRVLITGNRGVNVIDPGDLQAPHPPPPFVISGVTVNDTLDVVRQLGEDARSLDLNYVHHTLRIEFSAIDPGSRQDISYRCLLDGLEDAWIDPGDRRYVRYTGLSPGKYTFRAIASHNLGKWPDREISLAVTIAPPFWRTWWAYTIYCLALAGAIGGGLRFRFRQIALKHQAEVEHLQAERLAEIDRLKSRFFANVSHEFRTPLTLILGSAEQGMETVQDLTLRRKLGQILGNARKLRGMVEQLLDLSKLESGTMKLAVSRGVPEFFIRWIVMSFQPWAERKKVRLRFLSSDGIAAGYFDAAKLEKIIGNLLSNALKFTPEGGSITVTVGPVPVPGTGRGGPVDGMRLTVADTGPGIPPEHLPRIFNRFYRVETDHHVEGTGIGLALVWELTQLHRGSVEVESSAGTGTVFAVNLPIGRSAYQPGEIVAGTVGYPSSWLVEPAPSSDERRAFKRPSMTGRPTVLVVEDNRDLRCYLSELLAPDYDILEAANGKAGFTEAARVIPDLVISDIMMPVMDGVELCRALKADARTSHIPVILLTARADVESRVGGLESGADDYIPKPFEPRELAARVKNQIEQRKRLRQMFSSTKVLRPGEVTVSSVDDELLKRIMGYIERNIGREDLHIDDLAREVCMSRTTLNRKIHALTNLSPVDLIRYVRLESAYDLLLKGAGSVADVAYRVGFGSPSYFSRCFHKRFGIPPSELTTKNSTPLN